MRNVFVVVALALVVVVACTKEVPSQPVVVLATPSAADSGFARAVTDAFARRHPVEIDLRVVSAPAILGAAEARTGAIAIYRDPELDEELRARRALRLRTVVAFEDYVIVGPKKDPAHITKTKSAADAFREIVDERRVFCSPADLRVLLNVEREIWSDAEIHPPGGKRYRPCHGNAIEALAQAARFDAYTLTDRATAEGRLPATFSVLMRDVPILHNEYVMAELEYEQSRRNRNAEWLMEWAMSVEARDVVQSMRSANLPRLFLAGR